MCLRETNTISYACFLCYVFILKKLIYSQYTCYNCERIQWQLIQNKCFYYLQWNGWLLRPQQLSKKRLFHVHALFEYIIDEKGFKKQMFVFSLQIYIYSHNHQHQNVILLIFQGVNLYCICETSISIVFDVYEKNSTKR